MKKIFRMIIFSGVAIFITALWNKGFVIKADPLIYLKASLIIALVYYLITPISKIILLPLNIFTFGFVSVIFYAVCFLWIFWLLPSILSREGCLFDTRYRKLNY